MRRRGPTGEISFSFRERKHILSMVIIDVAANIGESKRRSLGFPPRGKWHASKGPCGSVWWLCVPSSGSCSLGHLRSSDQTSPFSSKSPPRGTTDHSLPSLTPSEEEAGGGRCHNRWREPNPAAQHSSLRLLLPSLAFDLRCSESPLAVRPTTTTTMTPNEIHRRRHQQRRGGRRTHWT